ncbi:MAG: UbiA family prenyltransferase, partial [Promethearchaeota archaeon]
MSLKAFVTIIRPANALFGSLTVIIGILTTYRIISSSIGSPWNFTELIFVLLTATLTYFCVASAGNVVNDIYDLEVDRVNRPNRPLPSGAMTVRQAKAWTVTLLVLGL